MNTIAIIYPTILLVALTFAVGIALLIYRVTLVRTRKLSPVYFKLNRGGKPPSRHDALEHNYSNLFEVPVLFYAVVSVAIATQNITPATVTLAWAFVGTRIAHTLVHVTYNNILHRLTAFFAGVIIVGVMWTRLVMDIVAVA